MKRVTRPHTAAGSLQMAIFTALIAISHPRFKTKIIRMKLATKLIHAGVSPDPSTGAIMTPIFQTSTYVQEAPGKNKGYEYARTQNPTREALESALAAIENAKRGICFGIGMPATDAVIKLLQPGDEVVAT